jgi:hypothetical protein
MCTTIQIAFPTRSTTTWDVGRKLLDSQMVVPIGDIDGEAMTLTSRCQCECGTALGSGSGPGAWNPQALAQDRRRLKKKGWSDHKIARWLDEKHSSHAKLERLAHERTAGASAQPVDEWLDFLRRALAEGAGRIGLRVSHGDDSWSPATPHVIRHISEATPAVLRAMEENTLYVFVH